MGTNIKKSYKFPYTEWIENRNKTFRNEDDFIELLLHQPDEAALLWMYGKGFILQGDLNAWLGRTMVPGDYHDQNKNKKAVWMASKVKPVDLC